MGLFSFKKGKEASPATASSADVPPVPLPTETDPFAVPTPDGASIPADMPPTSSPVTPAPAAVENKDDPVDALIEDTVDDPFKDTPADPFAQPSSAEKNEPGLQVPDLSFDQREPPTLDHHDAAPVADPMPPPTEEPEPTVTPPVSDHVPSPSDPMPPRAQEEEAFSSPVVSEPHPSPRHEQGHPFAAEAFSSPDPLPTPPVTNIFVEKRSYQQVLLAVTMMQEVLQSSEEGIAPLLSGDEAVVAKLVGLRSLLGEVQERLMIIDKRLFEEGDTNG